tara:strand:- start:25 stop:528 length:504 start_codon:yes stop_codon:yes gene_type:complete
MENKMKQGLFKGYKPNRLSLYLLMLSSGRSNELYDVIMKDMEKYKEEEPFYLISHTAYKEIFYDSTAYKEGTCLQGHVTLLPKSIVSKFGNPKDSDGYKVSGEYMFKRKETGDVYSLYDWKNTSLYDLDLIEPSEFWNSTKEYNFHIGASSNKNVKSFKKWIKEYTK